MLLRNRPQKVALFIAGLLFLDMSFAGEKQPDHTRFIGPNVTSATNLHFSGKYCEECHEKAPVRGKDSYLRFNGSFTQLCRCHGYTSGNYIHPVDIVPSEEKKARIPEELPLQDGKITCLTCHDIYRQCLENRDLNRMSQAARKFYRNELMFLRGNTLEKRTTLCFRCHDEQKYRMLDPHNQLTADGKVIAEKCLYCHVEKPDENKAGYGDVKLIGDIKVLCQRCHGPYDRHPASVDHYIQPSGKIHRRMQRLEEDLGLVLPLDQMGKLTCVTCHNPHDKGVIPDDQFGSKGAAEKYKHRIPEKMCKSCHGM